MSPFTWDQKLDQIQAKLDWMIKTLQLIYGKEIKIMATLDDILADVTEEDTVVDSVITLLQGIKAQLDDVLKGGLSAANQAKVDAIFARAESNKAKLGKAVTDNTPQEGGGSDTTGGGGQDTSSGGTVPTG